MDGEGLSCRFVLETIPQLGYPLGDCLIRSRATEGYLVYHVSRNESMYVVNKQIEYQQMALPNVYLLSVLGKDHVDLVIRHRANVHHRGAPILRIVIAKDRLDAHKQFPAVVELLYESLYTQLFVAFDNGLGIRHVAEDGKWRCDIRRLGLLDEIHSVCKTAVRTQLQVHNRERVLVQQKLAKSFIGGTSYVDLKITFLKIVFRRKSIGFDVLHN